MLTLALSLHQRGRRGGAALHAPLRVRYLSEADWPKLLRLAETDDVRCAPMRALYECAEKARAVIANLHMRCPPPPIPCGLLSCGSTCPPPSANCVWISRQSYANCGQARVFLRFAKALNGSVPVTGAAAAAMSRCRRLHRERHAGGT
jgi:hypothetical protein